MGASLNFVAVACMLGAATADLTATGFVPYYTYSGALAVSGTVGPMVTTAGLTQIFSYSLSGTDPSCADGIDSSSANSCGIHIHAGTSCTRDAEGHYYLNGVSDPWTSVVYTPDASGVVSGASATVVTGLDSQRVAGRTLIVHDKSGARIACAILGTGGTAALRAEGFVPYFNNPGFSVSGSVGPMTTSGTTQTFTYSLVGVDPLCSSGAASATPNSCGVHIHSGTSCSADALGHYYATPSDPWTTVAYTSTGDAASGTVSVETGYAGPAVNGRAFVVHAHDGSRIACAILASTTEVVLTAGSFVPYYTYSGNLAVSGTVGPMTTVGTSQTFDYSITGADPACVSGRDTSVANSCGIHIHAGTTCADHALGHYYTGATSSDPWLTVAYTSDGAGASSGQLTVSTGGSSVDVNGRAMIIHARDGSRIACALLGTGLKGASLAASAFVPYFNNPTFSVSGLVSGGSGSGSTTQVLTYALAGADPLCASGADNATPNSCGIHIHRGTSCSADALGHYYGGAVTTDPWTSIAYTSSASGEVALTTVSVDTGGYAGDVAGRTVIVHAHDGSRIACAILGQSTEVRLSVYRFSPYFSYLGNLAVYGVVSATTIGTTQTLTYSLANADPLCSSGANTSIANSCGIHIHAGTSCTADALGHYYTATIAADPWTSISYSSVGGKANGTANVNTGARSIDLEGRAIIVHAFDGSRIACSLLGRGDAPSEVATPPPASPPGGDSDTEGDKRAAIIVGSLFAAMIVLALVYFKFIRKPERPPPPPDSTPSGTVLADIKIKESA